MDNPICPACKAENEEDAAFCDQCGQPLAESPAPEEALEGSCPACGGAVQDRENGKGVCRSCGLTLFATAEAPQADPDAAAKLTAAILKKTGAGLPLEKAVAESCREILNPDAPAEAGEEAAGGETRPCPLCGVEAPETAPRCTGCGIWFHGFRTPQPCPRCDRQVAGDKCECGAILTLPKLLQYVERSVKFVCSRCKAPYASLQPKCPDCGGGLISAERIKAFAAGGGKA